MSELAHLPLRQVLCAGPGALKQLRSCRTWPRVWHWPPPVATRQWPTPPALSSARPLLPSTQKIAGVSKIFDAARGEFALANCDDPALKDIKPRRREHRLCQERGADLAPSTLHSGAPSSGVSEILCCAARGRCLATAQVRPPRVPEAAAAPLPAPLEPSHGPRHKACAL